MGFVRRARLDGERVNRVLHQFAKRLVHHAMARHGGLAGEGGRDDGQAPVRVAALAVAGMAAVAFAFVLELERLGPQDRKPGADVLGDAQDLSST
jgi:hypothetical protein